MPIKKHDFVELEFTGRLKDGPVFDTTDEKIAKENNAYNSQMEYKPAIIAVGENQVPPGLDEFLEGKELNKEYKVELKPEKAFGKKNAQKIKLVPLSAFKKQDIVPQPRLQVNIDNELGTILRVSGGRVLVDFNHPFSGQEITYTVKPLRIITDIKEKIQAFLKMGFNIPNTQVEVKENKAIITMPVDFPPPVLDAFKKKLIELTKVKEVEFKKEEIKKPSNESEKGLEKPKDSQSEEPQKPEKKETPKTTSQD